MKGWIGMLVCAIVTALIGWKVFGLLGLGVGLFFLAVLFFGGLGAIQEDKLDELKRREYGKFPGDSC